MYPFTTTWLPAVVGSTLKGFERTRELVRCFGFPAFHSGHGRVSISPSALTSSLLGIPIAALFDEKRPDVGQQQRAGLCVACLRRLHSEQVQQRPPAALRPHFPGVVRDHEQRG
jgi:hypothetical protein